jgi:hypothetical protein
MLLFYKTAKIYFLATLIFKKEGKEKIKLKKKK